MEPQPHDERPKKQKSRLLLFTVLVGAVVVLAGIAGWRISGLFDDDDKNNTATQQTAAPSQQPQQQQNEDVKSLVTYELPDGWREGSCPNSSAAFIIPDDESELDCSTDTASSVKISVDQAGNDDCNDLQNVQNVKKHVCVSQFINGMKSLNATTEYNQDSVYGRDVNIKAYYVNTGDEVVKVEYRYEGEGEHLAGYDSLANSINRR